MRYLAVILAAIVGAAVLGAAPPTRIHEDLNNGRTFVLSGHRLAAAAAARDMGEVPATLQLEEVEVHFKRTPAQTADLEALLREQRDRSSKQYHKWLTPEEFASRFGVNETDLRTVKAWLEAAGLTNVEMARSRTYLRMSGTAGTVGAAFATPIHQYVRGGTQFYASAADPVLPRGLEGVVSGIRGLSNYGPRSFISRRPRPQMSVGINGNHLLAPADLATIYNLGPLYGAGTDGTGQVIAVVGQSDVVMADIESFQSAAGLPIKDPAVVLVGEDPGSSQDDQMEADLDLEWAGAIARGASVIYVNSTNALVSAEYAIENDLAPVVSISYGLCEAGLTAADLAAYESAFQQANALGITVIAASGDSGAAACDDVPDAKGMPESVATAGLAVSYPASSAYVTAVGGTELDDAKGSFWNSSGEATSYIPEIAWNDTGVEKVLSGTGGGVSTQFPKPVWQQGSGVPADGFRDVPDIALSASPAHDPYLICSNGSCSNGFAPPLSKLYYVGGTSCATPVFAGMVALLNQTSQGRQGNVNPALYALASFNSGVFHDVELGDNRVPCQAGSPNCESGSMGFTAGPGYDLVTGLGSMDAAQLVEQWGSDFQVAVSPSTLTLSSGGSGSANIQITRFANFAGAVSLSCSVAGSLPNTTCSVPISVSGSSAGPLTVSNGHSTGAAIGWLPEAMTPSLGAFPLLVGAGVALWLVRRRALAMAGIAVLSVTSVTSCGSNELSSSVTPAVNYSTTGNVIITATSGVLQHSITVPVTISPSQ